RRSLAGQRQPLHRCRRRIGPLLITALRRLPARLADRAIPEDEDGAHRDREGCPRTAAADTVAPANSQLSTNSFGFTDTLAFTLKLFDYCAELGGFRWLLQESDEFCAMLTV